MHENECQIKRQPMDRTIPRRGIRLRLSLSLPLSVELLVSFFLLLPSLFSDLTVGGSPPESPPVSVDFLFAGARSRRPGDEGIGRNRDQCLIHLLGAANLLP